MSQRKPCFTMYYYSFEDVLHINEDLKGNAELLLKRSNTEEIDICVRTAKPWKFPYDMTLEERMGKSISFFLCLRRGEESEFDDKIKELAGYILTLIAGKYAVSITYTVWEEEN